MTTPTVRMPFSLAISATTGAAPVPVPPPMPAVTNTMSAPSSRAVICSLLSLADSRPTSGFAPAPLPPVSFSPMASFWVASEAFRHCRSVFTAMNSTPCIPERTMRFTTLLPPPPTPTTFSTSSWFAAESITNAIPMSSYVKQVVAVSFRTNNYILFIVTFFLDAVNRKSNFFGAGKNFPFPTPWAVNPRAGNTPSLPPRSNPASLPVPRGFFRWPGRSR